MQPVGKIKARTHGAAADASAGSSAAVQAAGIAVDGSHTELPIPGNISAFSDSNGTLAASVRRSLLSLRQADDATASILSTVHHVFLRCCWRAVRAAAATLGKHGFCVGVLTDRSQSGWRAVVPELDVESSSWQPSSAPLRRDSHTQRPAMERAAAVSGAATAAGQSGSTGRDVNMLASQSRIPGTAASDIGAEQNGTLRMSASRVDRQAPCSGRSGSSGLQRKQLCLKIPNTLLVCLSCFVVASLVCYRPLWACLCFSITGAHHAAGSDYRKRRRQGRRRSLRALPAKRAAKQARDDRDEWHIHSLEASAVPHPSESLRTAVLSKSFYLCLMLQRLPQEGSLDRCALPCSELSASRACALLAGAAWEDEREEWHATGVEEEEEEEQQGECPELGVSRSSATMCVSCVYRGLEQTLRPVRSSVQAVRKSRILITQCETPNH